MRLQEILALALAALLVFWMLGAHNRLVALRNAIGAAWTQVDEPLQRRLAATLPLATGLRELLHDEQRALDAVEQAAAQVRTAADALRQRPADAPRAAMLAAAESTLGAVLSRLLALLEHRADLRADSELAPHVAALHETTPRLAFARQLFNDAARSYNAALRQFPTRLLARLFGFGPAGTL